MPPKLEHSAVTIQHLWPTFGTAAACLFLITCHYWRMKNCWINVSYVYYVVLLWGGVLFELDENQEWSQDWWRDCTMLTNQLATASTHPRASKSSVSAPKNMNSSSIYPRIGNEYHAGVSPGCIGSSVYTGHFTRASGPLAIASLPGPSNTLSLP